VTTGGVVTTLDFFLQVIKNLCSPTVQVIDNLTLLDIVLLLLFTKFKKNAFSRNGSNLKFKKKIGILQIFVNFEKFVLAEC
jgi:hypothetical protein